MNDREVMWTCATCLRMGALLVGAGETYWQVEDRMLAMHHDVNPECQASKLRARLYEDRPITAAAEERGHAMTTPIRGLNQ